MSNIFHYKAVNEKGQTVSGSISAENQQAVTAQLHARGYYPTRISKRGSVSLDALLDRLQRRAPARLGQKALLRTTADLEALLGSGLGLDQALTSLRRARKGPLAMILEALRTDIKNGLPLSSALARHPGSFDSFYVAVIKAGEASGDLPAALKRLSLHLERKQALGEAVLGTVLYPLILLSVTILSLLFMLVYIIPRFALMFEGSDEVLPLVSRLVFSASSAFLAFWPLLLALVVAAAIGLPALLRTRPEQCHQLLLRLPVVGEVTKANATALFSRAMGTLLDSGLNPVEALSLTGEGVRNRVLQVEINAAREQVKAGKRLSRSMAQSQILPELARELITLGEDSGQLAPMFNKAADIFEKQSEQTLKRALVVLEPVLIIGLGLMIAIIITSVLLAMLAVNDLVI